MTIRLEQCVGYLWGHQWAHSGGNTAGQLFPFLWILFVDWLVLGTEPNYASVPRCHLQPSFLLFSLRQSFTKLPRLALDSLWSPCWLWIFDPLFFTYRSCWIVGMHQHVQIWGCWVFFVCLNSFNSSWLFEERFFCWVRQKEESQPQLISDIC